MILLLFHFDHFDLPRLLRLLLLLEPLPCLVNKFKVSLAACLVLLLELLELKFGFKVKSLRLGNFQYIGKRFRTSIIEPGLVTRIPDPKYLEVTSIS